MASLLERGPAWLRGKLPNAAAVDVQVRTKDEAIEKVKAVPGRAGLQQYLVSNATGSEQFHDWIIAEQDLVFPTAGKQEPKAGWEMWWQVEDGRWAVFKVEPVSDGRPFDVLDPLGMLYRVHTLFNRYEESA